MTEIETPRIGVYLCYCGINIASKINIEEVVKFAKELPNVIVASEYKYMCSEPGQELIRAEMKKYRLNRIVVASCSPLMHESTFRRVTTDGGQNEFLFQMTNIREHVSWVTEDEEQATQKAKALVAGAIRRVIYHQPLTREKVNVNPDVLVVGGGIAGIHASLTLANAGKKIYLVEREPTIGGHMAKFDKTFPTLDCSACILTPKMSSVQSHPNIELMTLSEVIEVSGYVGNFKVKVKKKPRFVDLARCSGCGECQKECPVEVNSEFDEGLSKRKAIYRPFPQSVPSGFTIDKKGISACRNTCPIGLPIQGYIALIARGKYQQAYELIKQKVPFPASLGRVCYHPCETKCERGKIDEPIAICALKRFVADYGKEIRNSEFEIRNKEKVAIIGSGPAGLTCANDLVKKGYQVTVFEALPVPGGMLAVGIPEYRLPKDILNREIEVIKNLGVEIKTNIRIDDLGRLKEEGYKAIFIACGSHKSIKMGIENEDATGVIDCIQFLQNVNLGKEVVIGKKVGVIGGGNSAIDAARTALRIGSKVSIIYRRTRQEMPATDEEIKNAEYEGIEIKFLTAPKRAIIKDGKIIGLECLKMELREPDESGRCRPVPIEGSEFIIELDNIISAIGQKPNLSFLDKEIKITPQGTIAVDPITFQTSVPGIFAGGEVSLGPASVVEAIANGIEAAISIDRYLRGEDLSIGRKQKIQQVEEVNKKGIPKQSRPTMRKIKLEERIASFKEVELGLSEDEAQLEALRCLNCAVCSECEECVRVCEPKAIEHQMKEETVEVDVGSIIVSTGFKTFDPTNRLPEYGYRFYPGVYTSLEIERLLNSSGPTLGKLITREGNIPQTVGIIHCVGSRDKKTNVWCSKVCCMYSLKLAHLIKERTGARVYNFYIDMRTAGKGYEEFYERLLHEGMQPIRGRIAEISDWAMTPEEEGKLVIRVEDTLIGIVRRIPVEMVVLSVGLEPHLDSQDVRRLFNISCSPEGWFLERHPKLAPVSTFTDGVFLAGACQGPKDIPDSVAQAGAASAEAIALIDKGYVELEPNTAWIDEEVCAGCKICNGQCPFRAISFDTQKAKSVINQALCKGCGTCVSTCPSGAAQQKMFLDKQIYEEIKGILSYV